MTATTDYALAMEARKGLSKRGKDRPFQRKERQAFPKEGKTGNTEHRPPPRTLTASWFMPREDLLYNQAELRSM